MNIEDESKLKFSKETVKDLRKSKEDIKKGRTIPLEEMRNKLFV